MKTHKNITLTAAMVKADQISQRAALIDFVPMSKERETVNKMVPMYILRDNGFATFCEHKVLDEEILDALETIGALWVGCEHQMLTDMSNAESYFRSNSLIFNPDGGMFKKIVDSTGEIPEIVDTALMFFMDIMLHPNRNYFERGMHMTGYDTSSSMSSAEIASTTRMVELFRNRHYGLAPQMEINEDIVKIVSTAISVSDVIRDNPRYGYMYSAIVNGIAVYVTNRMGHYAPGLNVMQRAASYDDSSRVQYANERFIMSMESGIPLKEHTPKDILEDLARVIRAQADQNLKLIENIIKSMDNKVGF